MRGMMRRRAFSGKTSPTATCPTFPPLEAFWALSWGRVRVQEWQDLLKSAETFLGVTTNAGEGIVDTAAQDDRDFEGFWASDQVESPEESPGQRSGKQSKGRRHFRAASGDRRDQWVVGGDGRSRHCAAAVAHQACQTAQGSGGPGSGLPQAQGLYGVETQLHSVPSRHVSVSLTSFAPEDWSLPHVAEDDGPEGEGRTDASRGIASVNSPQPLCSEPLAEHWRQAVRPDAHREARAKHRAQVSEWLPDGSLRLLGLAASSLAALGEPVRCYPSGVFLDHQSEAAGVRPGDQGCSLSWPVQQQGRSSLLRECLLAPGELKGAGNQYSKEIWCGRCKAGWEDLIPKKLAQAEMEKERAERVSQVLCHCKTAPNKWEVKKTVRGQALLPMPAKAVRFLPVGSEHRRRSGVRLDCRILWGGGRNSRRVPQCDEGPDGGHDECPGNRPPKEVEELKTYLRPGCKGSLNHSRCRRILDMGWMDGIQVVPQVCHLE